MQVFAVWTSCWFVSCVDHVLVLTQLCDIDTDIFSPSSALFASEACVVTFDPLWLPGDRVALNLQLSVSRRRVKTKIKSCKKKNE